MLRFSIFTISPTEFGPSAGQCYRYEKNRRGPIIFSSSGFQWADSMTGTASFRCAEKDMGNTQSIPGVITQK